MLDALLCEFEGVLADTARPRLDALRASFSADGELLGDAELRRDCAGLPMGAAVRAALATLGQQRDDSAVALLTLRAERELASRLARGLVLAEGVRDFVEAAQ